MGKGASAKKSGAKGPEDYAGKDWYKVRIHAAYLFKVQGMSEEDIARHLRADVRDVRGCLGVYGWDRPHKSPKRNGPLRRPEPGEVEHWIEEAAADMRMAHRAYAEFEYRSAAFLSNMGLEKYVKAFLLKCGVIQDPADISHIKLPQILNIARQTDISVRMDNMIECTKRMLKDRDSHKIERKGMFGMPFDDDDQRIHRKKRAERDRLQKASDMMDLGDLISIKVPPDDRQKDEISRAREDRDYHKELDLELKFCLERYVPKSGDAMKEGHAPRSGDTEMREGFVPKSDDARREEWVTYIAVRKLYEMKMPIHRSRYHRDMSQFPMKIGSTYSTDLYRRNPTVVEQQISEAMECIIILKRSIAMIPEWWNNGREDK